MLSLIGLVTTAWFAGAAVYINRSEQPARLQLDDISLLRVWRPSYAKGLEMQASLALISGILGIAAFVVDHSVSGLIGGLLMIANWPYTLAIINPINKRLYAINDADAGVESRELIERWGRLHAVRSGLGFAGTVAFFLAVLRV